VVVLNRRNFTATNFTNGSSKAFRTSYDAADYAHRSQLNEIIVKACASLPQDRFQSAAELRAELLNWSGRFNHREQTAQRKKPVAPLAVNCRCKT